MKKQENYKNKSIKQNLKYEQMTKLMRTHL